jgi:hypothetical protein
MSNKDFIKGIEAGAKPFEEKFKQQANAINRVSDKLEKGMEKVSGVVGEVINELTSIEKKRLYDLNTQYDLINLEDHEKELLLSCLYTLAGDTANENQKSFVRSVQRYLEIKNPQTSIDLSGVENVENLNSQKAMFQTFSEFLFLANENDSFVDEYEEFFDYFSVSKKDRAILLNNVKQIFNATGVSGLCEKYGFVAESELKAFKDDIIKIEKLQIKNEVHVSAGEEKKYYGKEIRLSANITCEGNLVFDHCVLIYNGDNITGKINMEDYEASLSFIKCTIIGKNNKTPAEYPEGYLIEGYSGKIHIEDTLFYNCRCFIDISNPSSETDIQNCKFQYSEQQKSFYFIKANSEKSSMQNCIIENLNTKPIKIGEDDRIDAYLFLGIKKIMYCSFKNILGSINGKLGEEDLILTGSSFDQCIGVIEAYNAKIVYCLFENCENIFSISPNKLDLKNSQFIGCKNKIIETASEAEIEYCDFFNYRADSKEYGSTCFNFGDLADSFDLSGRTSLSGPKEISHCLFDGMFFNEDSTFILCHINKGRKYGVSIEKCKFLHCVKKGDDEFINQSAVYYGAFGSAKQAEVIDIEDCTGLNTVNKKGQGDKAIDIVIKHETPTGEPIGANSDEIMAGLSGIKIEEI